jgi:UDP-N-acetylmuramoyl-L-alanyl-D-glutamate--2,6-diaminopimelate ligase
MTGATIKPLTEVLRGVPGVPGISVSDLTLDAASVQAGGAFVALRGMTRHGLDFAAEAEGRGAVAVLWDPTETPARVPALSTATAIPVPGLRARLGDIADRFFDEPSAQLAIAAVTGTNGKTTCAWLLAAALGRLGIAAAYSGTLGTGRPPAVRPGSHTTPDVLSLHRQLAELRATGVTHVAMEVSSHALDQRRVDGVRLRIAAFTNLSRDHLDYHGTMDRYAAAKARLFALPGVGHAVVNLGDAAGRRYADALPQDVTLTAIATAPQACRGAPRHVVARRVTSTLAGLEVQVDTHAGSAQVTSPLIGDFNAENLLAVLGMLLAFDVPLADAAAALAATGAPPGRMETFAAPNGGPLCVVDYAHSPDALAKALGAARRHCRGRLTVVFGCGGERDPGKRAEMGAIAERLADVVIVTDDNPRSEPPDAIVAMILAGMHRPGSARVLHDRAAAIALAYRQAAPGDVVLVAGKGHEDYQLTASGRRTFSDRTEVGRLTGAAA